MTETSPLVDPVVTKAKFDREIARFRENADDHARNGCWLAKAEYPKALVIFGTPRLKPPVVAFGAAFDFTNYDLWPPSVRLVDPFTQVPYKARELPTPLPRRLQGAGEQPAPGVEVAIARLAQWYGLDDLPFICLPGVREYHDHPGHSGDSWLLRRGTDEGTLHSLVTHLYHYGTEYLSAFHLGIIGLMPSEIPA